MGKNSKRLLIYQITGPVASNHSNLYNKLLSLVLGRYGVPHAEVNSPE